MPVFGVLAVALGLMPLWPIYQSPGFIVAVAVGCLAGSLAALLVSARRWPWWTLPILLIGLFALLGVPVAVPHSTIFSALPTLQGVQELFVGAVAAWKQIVTITPPVGDYGALLVPVFMMSLVGAAVAVVLGRVRRFRALALLPGVALVCVAIWLGPDDARLSVPAGVALTAVLLVAMLFGTPGGVWRKVVALALTIVVLGVSGFVTGLMSSQPDVWRSRVVPTLDQESLPSPLSAYRAYAVGDLSETPMFTTQDATAGDMLTLATLSRYDGVTYTVWTPDGDFTRQADYALADGVDTSSALISIEQLTGPWLPLQGDLTGMQSEGVGLGSLYYSPNASTAVDLNGLTSGLSYRVSGPGVRAANLQTLRGEMPGSAKTVVSDEPAGVQAFASANSQSADEPGARLVDVLDALRQKGYISHGGSDEPASRSGHSADRITALLTDKLMIGDAEQYAVAATLLAQQVGFPARIVVGFVVPESSPEIRGSDLTAWVEVNTERGWVALDPVPEDRPIPDAPPEDPNKVSPPQSVVEPPPADISQVRSAQAPQSDQSNETDAPDPIWILVAAILQVLGWVLLVGVVLLVPPLTILVAKLWRRRRRLSALHPRARIMGAQRQVADVLVDAHYPIGRATTNREMVQTVPVDQAGQLAFVMDRAEYSLDDMVAADARAAWLVVAEIESELMSGLTRRARWARRLSLRSFVNRVRRPRRGREAGE